MIVVILVVVNIVSLLAAFFYRRKLLQVKQRPNSIELEEFLLDLMSGGGLLHIKRVSPNDVILRMRNK